MFRYVWILIRLQSSAVSSSTTSSASSVAPRLTSCLECREDYQGQLRRHRYAERDAEELEKNVWRACQVDQLVTTKESSIPNTHEENMNQQEHFPLTLKIKKLKSRIVLKLMLHWLFTLISIKKDKIRESIPFYLIDTVQSAAELQTFRHDQEGRPVSLSLSLSLSAANPALGNVQFRIRNPEVWGVVEPGGLHQVRSHMHSRGRYRAERKKSLISLPAINMERLYSTFTI